MTSVDPTTVLGAALDALVEPVLITDAEGGLTFANATAARVLGAVRDVGHPVSDLLDRLPARTPDGGSLAPALHPIRRALAQAQAVIGAELTIDLEGGPATFLVNTVPLRDAEGRLTGSVSVFHDVTGARQLEREAAEHAARLRTLVDLVNEGIFIIAADGALLFTNGVGRSLLGAMPAGERPADRIDRLRVRSADGTPLPPERLPSYRALHGETVSSMELLIATVNGTTRRGEVSAHPLRRDGAVYATVVTWRDVTDEARARADLEAARAAAEEANRLKDDFIAALSHELRTPLQPILGWTEVLRRHGKLDDVTTRAMEVVHRNIRQQVRLVDDLLDLSRILHGKFILRLETFDLRDGVRARVRLKVSNHNVDATLRCRAGVLKHLKSLANTRSVAQIDFQVATLSFIWHDHGGELMRENSYIHTFGGSNKSKDGVTEEPITPVFMRAMSYENLCYPLLASKFRNRTNWIVALKYFNSGASVTRGLQVGLDRGVFVLRPVTLAHIHHVELALESLFVSLSAFDHSQCI